MAGASFSHTLDSAGTFDYFCMVHPWMTGTVIVEAEAAHGDEHAEEMGHMEEMRWKRWDMVMTMLQVE